MLMENNADKTFRIVEIVLAILTTVIGMLKKAFGDAK